MKGIGFGWLNGQEVVGERGSKDKDKEPCLCFN